MSKPLLVSIKSLGFFLIALALSFCESYAQSKFSDKDIFVPNQLIVKLKDEISITNKSINANKTSFNKELDELILRNKVKNIERIFNEKGSTAQTAKQQGVKKKYENVLLLSFAEEAKVDVLELQKLIQSAVEVEYAEPNYIFSIDNTTSKSEETVVKRELFPSYNKLVYPTAVMPNDPLFSSQENLLLTNVPQVWETTKGDSIKIAVLDTGVDWEHPDLQGNIWENKIEKNGISGMDDDGNGYVDDIRGWDWINGDNNPTDDNSHGTHVAGIIAARGDNGIGISGVNWYGKIMALKVLQSTGRGDAVTIAQAVEYAAANGAKIINLSLGGYYESLALKSALENAYSKCFIVAAAGNDAKGIGPNCQRCAPLYPAAYSFIMGVQDKVDAKYSNYDQDGPFATEYSNLLNYEIHAPGIGILSLSPNGGYRSLTGTSMATPVVSGIASLYMSMYPNFDKEFLFGHIINTEDDFINAEKMVLTTSKPTLAVPKYEIVDNCIECDNDGKADAGETVNLRLFIKNSWALAKGVNVKIGYENLADKSLVTFPMDSSYVGDISPNAMGFSVLPLLIKISDKVYHGADYKIKVDLNDSNGHHWSQDISITFQNAISFGGFLTKDVTLYPNKLYVVAENLVLDNCTMTIKPGTVLKFDQGKGINLSYYSKIVANGKPDSLIYFTSDSFWAGIKGQDSCKYDYSVFENIKSSNAVGLGRIDHSTFRYNDVSGFTYGWVTQSNFLLNKSGGFSSLYYLSNDLNYINNNNGLTEYGDPRINSFNNVGYDFKARDIGSGGGIILMSDRFYLGTDDSLQASFRIYDYFDYTGLPAINTRTLTTKPFSNAPGIVWKLTIDDKELASNRARTEDVLELGPHSLKVYFNRAMDTVITPSISFGQRSPYNQVSIADKGHWSADSTSYTVSREFTIGDPKGIVNFNISGAKDDMGMEIPYERDRFRVNLQSTGSKSLNFGTTALCGKVDLNWDNLRSEGSDIVGYNIYRRQKLADNSNNSFTLLNNKLVLDNQYRDYKVELDKTYEYLYTAVRAGMNNESDSSYVVEARPLASKLADVNGDSTVTVLDIVGSVNYILQKDPTPFIFKQSDLNNDQVINVLDVIGIIDRVLNPVAASAGSDYDYNSLNASGRVDVYRIQDTLYMRSSSPVAGIQTAEPVNQVKWLSWAKDWEKIKTPGFDTQERWMLYGFNKSLDVRADRAIGLVSGKVDPGNWIVSAKDGTPLKVNYLGVIPRDKDNVSDLVKVSDIYPNPSDGHFKVYVQAKQRVKGFSIEAYNMAGTRIFKQEPSIENQVNVYDIDLNQPKGIYILKVSWLEDSGTKVFSKKIVIQ